MLTRFCVENFKNFKDRFEWDLTQCNNYEFNEEAVGRYCVKKGLIFGVNGSGKSNLGLALFDIILHLTDRAKLENKYVPYLNLDSSKKYAEFEYHFMFSDVEVVYKYQKKSSRKLLKEQLMIDGQEVIFFDHVEQQGSTRLIGTETLNLKSDNDMSRVKYVKSNAILEDNLVNHVFYQFVNFVDSMLLFYSLDERRYQGIQVGTHSVSEGIIESGRLKDFEEFLRTQGIDYTLVEREVDGNKRIYCVFEEGEANFFTIASTGTKSLTSFYYWYIIMDSASLVFIDEFDAFYHFALAKQIVQLTKELENTQIFFTSHNTDLISNDLLRPDCYFNLANGKINSIASLTDKELRRAHNLQKMYKAGAFDEE